MGKILKLDYIENNSHQPEKVQNPLVNPSFCQRPVGFFAGILQTEKFNVVKSVHGNLRCNSWECDFCRPKKIKELRKRLYNSEMMEDYRINGFRDKFSQKFLTLTCPGKVFRETYTPLEAYEIMSHCYDKLTRALKKKNGDYKFLKVCEKHKDGFPHFHVVMIGENIAKKDILDEIKELWCLKYGLGYVKMNIITNSPVHAIRYITKYLTKGVESMGKGKKIFTASRGALEKKKKFDWLDKRVFIGCVRDGENGVVVEEHEVDMSCPDAMMKIMEYLTTDVQLDSLGFDPYEKKMIHHYCNKIK